MFEVSEKATASIREMFKDREKIPFIRVETEHG